jgi:hypothetical protein
MEDNGDSFKPKVYSDVFLCHWSRQPVRHPSSLALELHRSQGDLGRVASVERVKLRVRNRSEVY